ncbi:hypothetical protein K1719_034040 [Acacia pycnantha]|nr:hypothetical protein K1719_034040 [Acacia pycnantha]
MVREPPKRKKAIKETEPPSEPGPPSLLLPRSLIARGHSRNHRAASLYLNPPNYAKTPIVYSFVHIHLDNRFVHFHLLSTR